MPTTNPGPGPTAFAEALARAAAAQAALATAIAVFTDADCRAPSALPGWSRGHVLTHLARNADGLGNLARWAATGVETPMYASAEARAADIEAGADRSATALRADVADAAARLMERLADLPADRLDAAVRMRTGARIEAWQLPLLRRREVEIHHVDLGAGYAAPDWPDDFVTATLTDLAAAAVAGRPTGVQALVGVDGRTWAVGESGPELHGPAPRLLEWLVGRGDGRDLRCVPAGPVPAAPAWA